MTVQPKVDLGELSFSGPAGLSVSAGALIVTGPTGIRGTVPAGQGVVLSEGTYPMSNTGTVPVAIDALLAFRCDALILLGTEMPETRVAEIAALLPVVVAGRRLIDPVADNVRTDDAVGMQLAVEHLVSLGHRDIAHVDGGDTVKSEDRVWAGFRRVLRSGLQSTDVRVSLHGGMLPRHRGRRKYPCSSGFVRHASTPRDARYPFLSAPDHHH